MENITLKEIKKARKISKSDGIPAYLYHATGPDGREHLFCNWTDGTISIRTLEKAMDQNLVSEFDIMDQIYLLT